MAGEARDNIWPLPKFYFSVDLGDVKDIRFQEVSGLETETQLVEYRHGDSPQFSTIKMPGIAKFGNVVLKKGIFANDSKFWGLYDQVKMNVVKGVPVTIKLLDETGNATMTWVLTNARPIKIAGTDLKTDANELAIESIELAHEGLTIHNPGG